MTEPIDIPRPLSKSEKRKAAGKKVAKKPKPVIPVLPDHRVNLEDLKTPDQRAVACVNLRLAGAPWPVIAAELHYASEKVAESAYVAALAGMYPMSNWETLRQEAALRAEAQLRRSTQMATADYFVDANDPKVKIPNTDRRHWHQQAERDLALLVTITGAKAPARLEVTADSAELNQMLSLILQTSGDQPALEPNIFDMDDIIDVEEITDGEED